jgi:hypothetical protein
LQFDAEEIEGALLDLGWAGEQSHRWSAAPSHGVARECGEISKQSAEAVDGLAAIGAPGLGFALGGRPTSEPGRSARLSAREQFVR